ncbi:hypothetical protein Vadar_029634 [Vaccinium darrowii]|uniref:Uncharacterized protein n=1 Tax=Vaccinium darrowii TaxID=229202 RepID=A0ACB7ZEV6_9ERIC|nr:hypothetical protein Vadar_029634 [Vaccinium darrowii]
MNDILEEEIGPTQPGGDGVEVGKKANAKAANAKVANGKAQHKRANQSMVWDHFSIITEDGDPNPRAACDYCQADYACHSTKNGTSAMKSHLTYQCRAYELSQKNLDKKQKTLGFESVKGEDGLEMGGKLSIVNFSVEACVKALAEMLSESQKDPLLRSLACAMKSKFEKYWKFEKVNSLLMFGFVLDPRYKFKYVAWCLKKCYDKEVVDLMVEEIKNEMGELYDWYEKNGSHALPLNDLGQSTNKTMDEEEGMDSLEKMKFRFKMHLEEENNLVSKSELERDYMDEVEKLEAELVVADTSGDSEIIDL